MTAFHKLAAFTLPLTMTLAAVVAAGLVCEILRTPQTPPARHRPHRRHLRRGGPRRLPTQPLPAEKD